MLVMSIVSLGMEFAWFPLLFLNGVKQDGVISPVLFCIYWINFLINWEKQELAAILVIFSLLLLLTQMILCYWFLRLGICNLCLVYVIIMR